MPWYLWIVAGVAVLWSVRASLRGRCWHWVPQMYTDDGGPHARTKLLRTDFGLPCIHCSGAYQQRVDSASKYPLPVVRLWECRCGKLWTEGDHEDVKEYAERMADLTIAEDAAKPIITPPPKSV